MKKVRLLLYAAMLPLLMGGCAGSSDGSQGDAIANIMTRTSVRKFTGEAVSDALVEQMLRAGMAAPTAANKQPWEFVVVDDAALLDTLQAAVPHAPIARGGCKQAIVVCGNMQKALEGDAQSYWIQDCSAATENILLAAHSLGLGAVWCGVTPQRERVEGVSRALNLPTYVRPLGLVVFGHPAESPAPKDKWKPENVHRNATW